MANCAGAPLEQDTCAGLPVLSSHRLQEARRKARTLGFSGCPRRTVSGNSGDRAQG